MPRTAAIEIFSRPSGMGAKRNQARGEASLVSPLRKGGNDPMLRLAKQYRQRDERLN